MPHRRYSSSESSEDSETSELACILDKDEYVLRIRVADLEDKDFIEIDYHSSKLNYKDLVETICAELGIDKFSIQKLRKLPDVRIHCDADVERFSKVEYVEVVIIPFLKQQSYAYLKGKPTLKQS